MPAIELVVARDGVGTSADRVDVNAAGQGLTANYLGTTAGVEYMFKRDVVLLEPPREAT